MMDVIHLFYEEDAIPAYEQHQEIKSAVRTVIYEQMYKRNYAYKLKPSHGRTAHGSGSLDDIPDLSAPADNQEIKPYLPPTNPEDLPGILEPPMGR